MDVAFLAVCAELYERVGHEYSRVRRADPRIARVLDESLGDAWSVVNVGAGTGSYEPRNRRVVAVEPSSQMRLLRAESAARCLAGTAERVPLADQEVDAAMAVYTDFHWTDRRRGIDELRRVSRKRVVILTVDDEVSGRYWLFRDYFPAANQLFGSLSEMLACFPTPPTVRTVPIPADCSDGFIHAFWKRPDMILQPAIHGPMAALSLLAPEELSAGFALLRADLESGEWSRRNSELEQLDCLDVGHRIVVWDHRRSDATDSMKRPSNKHGLPKGRR